MLKLRLFKVRPFCITWSIVALIELMTGPAGSQQAPFSGIQGSFADRASFFGLFATYRWVTFLGIAIVVALLIWLVQRGRTWFTQRPNTSMARKTISTAKSLLVMKPRVVLQHRPVRWAGAIALVVIAFALPHVVTDPFWQTQMVEAIAIYVLLALGLNVVVGFAGLLDLGFVAFYAIGAYATAWVTGSLPLNLPFFHHLNTFWAIPVALFLVIIAGVVLGAPTLRLRGDYLAIVTLGFGEIVTIFANNLNTVTGASQGSNQVPHFSIHLGPLKYTWGLGPVPYYYLAVGFIVLFIILFSLLEHSRVGRAWTAIREDEVAAESVGINPLKYKVMAFAIGAASAGFAGVLTAGQTFFVTPATYTLPVSINILVLVIFGGMGSIRGVVIGAILIQTISQYLIHTPPPGYQAPDLYMYLGAMLVVMMIFRPAGLIPSRRRHREIALSELGEGHMNEVLTGDEI